MTQPSLKVSDSERALFEALSDLLSVTNKIALNQGLSAHVVEPYYAARGKAEAALAAAMTALSQAREAE